MWGANEGVRGPQVDDIVAVATKAYLGGVSNNPRAP